MKDLKEVPIELEEAENLLPGPLGGWRRRQGLDTSSAVTNTRRRNWVKSSQKYEATGINIGVRKMNT